MSLRPKHPPVWTLTVRLTHAAVAALVVFNLFNETGAVHRFAGYAAAGLVLLRLAYGLSRPRADPAHLHLPNVPEVQHHLGELRRRRVQPRLGHNPLGMWMAWALWGLVLALGITGWMCRLDAFWGDDWLIDLHQGLATALQFAVLGHLAGVATMSVLQRENLAAAMVTGVKRRQDS